MQLDEEIRILKNILIYLTIGEFKLSFAQMGELAKAVELIQNRIKILSENNDNPN